MRKYGLYLTMLVAVLFCTTSCGDDDKDNHQERWMIANQNAFNAIRTNSGYKEIKSPGNEGSIFYKVIEEGDGTDSIYYTSTVTCYYKGWLIADYPELNFKNGHVFDKKLYDDGPPASFTAGGVIKGWSTALQHMKKGDKWEIWIPYQLGYERNGTIDQITKKISIPGYSTLVFELEILNVKGIDDK